MDIENDIIILSDNVDDEYLLKSRKMEMINLETRREKIHAQQEYTWCLKSRALWILEGDANTKFFHRYSSFRRNINSIHELRNGEGETRKDIKELKRGAISFFSNIYKKDSSSNLASQLRVLNIYPRLFHEDEVRCIGKSMTLEEVKEVVKCFVRDKIPGPDD